MATTALRRPAPGLKDVLQQFRPMIGNLGGFIVGNLAVSLLNKVLKVDPTDATQKGIKKILPPIAVSGGAVFGMTKVDNPDLKNVLQGAAVAGSYRAAKVLMPTASFLAGDDSLGLTPVAAISSNDRWLYHERTPISGMGFPDLGSVQPPQSNSGYYLDAPAYMGEPEQEPTQGGYFRGAAEEQFYGNEEELSGQADEYANQMYGSGDDMQIL